jgi:NADH-quinone oxidoreductase subunit L
MIVPLVALAIGAMTMGFVGSPFAQHWFQTFVYFGEPEVVPLSSALPGYIVSLVIVLVGGGAAYLLYRNDHLTQRAPVALTRLLQRRYYIDDFYYGVVTRIAQAPTYLLAWFDRNVVDRLVDFTGGAVAASGDFLRRLQTGSIQLYAWLVVAGAAVIAFAFSFAQGGSR